MPTQKKVIRKYKCGLMSNKRCNFKSWNNRFQWNGTSFIWSADCATQLQTKQCLKLCGWRYKRGIETLWIYYNIMVQLYLLSQSFILCFKMSTVIFPLPFSSISVVQMDYLNKSNPGHHGSTEAEPQLFPSEVKQDAAWLQDLSPPYQGAAGLLGSTLNRWGLPTHIFHSCWLLAPFMQRK